MWRRYTHDIRDTGDVNEHAASLPQWDQQYEQISGGRFEGCIEELRIGPAQLFRERTRQAVLQRGMPRPGTLTLAVPVRVSGESVFCGQRLGPAQALAMRAGDEFELVTHGEFDVVALDVDLDFLADYARRVDALDLDGRLPHSGTLSDAGGGSCAALRELLLTTLRTAREAGALLQHEPMRRALVHATCDVMLARLREAPAEAPPPVTAATRQRVVREAREYMRRHAGEPIGVPELCAALQVSRRTLQYSFQDVLQLGPVAYLRALRLNGVRRDLSRGGPEPVADCAARWGFWHLSRFAADYRALFGELPSCTLHRARAAGGHATH